MCLGSDQLADLDGAELEGWIDGSRLEMFVTLHKAIHCTQDVRTPSTAQVEELEKFEQFEVGVVGSRKFVAGR